MNKKLLLICILIVSIIVAFGFCVLAFYDVPDDHWAIKYITELANKGIINGYEDGSFGPQGTITRAEFIKLIVCTDKDLLELTENIIENQSIETHNWFDKYVAAAAGVLDVLPRAYTDEELNKPITRVEVAYILNQFCNHRGVNKEEETSYIVANQDEYTKAIRQYAKEYKYIVDDKLSDEEFYTAFSNLTDEQREKVMQNVSAETQLNTISEDDFMGLYDYLKEIMIEKKYIMNSNLTEEEVSQAFEKLSQQERLEIEKMLEEAYLDKLENQSYDETWAIYEVGKQEMLNEGYIQSVDITEEEFAQVLDGMEETEKMIFKQNVAEKYYKQTNQVFNDVSSLSYDELAAIVNIKKYGIINGYEDGSFKPYNNMTRAEATTVIYKFLELVEEG